MKFGPISFRIINGFGVKVFLIKSSQIAINSKLYVFFYILIPLQVELCRECIEWARNEKRTYLRQALEVFIMSVITDPIH